MVIGLTVDDDGVEAVGSFDVDIAPRKAMIVEAWDFLGGFVNRSDWLLSGTPLPYQI